MKNNTINTQNGQMMPILASDISMSSYEISELLGLRHDSVKRTVERLANRGVIEFPPLVEIPTSTKPRTDYIFSGEQGKRDSIIVVAQLSPEVTAKLVDRWQELEAQVQQLSVPQDLPSALRLAADLAEENARIADERNHAIATKGQICTTRGAKALGLLGAAKKENKKLKEQLGIAETYKQVKAISWLKDVFDVKKPAAYSQIGKAIKKVSDDMGIPPIEIEDTRHASVYAHHIDVISEFKVRLESNSELLAKYRKVGLVA